MKTITAFCGLTVSGAIHFTRRGRGGSKELVAGPAPAVSAGRVPRVVRLMALAIRFDRLVHDRVVADYAELARLLYVTRARVSQIISLLNLASDIQESILDLPQVESGRDPIVLRDLLPIATCIEWRRQRSMWNELCSSLI